MKESREMNHNHNNKVKAYVEINEEIANNEELKKIQPTPQPKEYDEIEY